MGGCGTKNDPGVVEQQQNPMQEHGRSASNDLSTKAQPAPARPASKSTTRNGTPKGESAENQMVSQMKTARIAKARQRRGNVVNETIDVAEEAQGYVDKADFPRFAAVHHPPDPFQATNPGPPPPLIYNVQVCQEGH